MQAFKGPPPVESHRTHLIPPATNCDNTGEMLPIGKLVRASMPRVFTEGSSYRHICQANTKIPDFQKDSRYSSQTILLFKLCRHSGPLIS